MTDNDVARCVECGSIFSKDLGTSACPTCEEQSGQDVTVTVTIPHSAYVEAAQAVSYKYAAIVTARYMEAAARQIREGHEQGQCTFGRKPLAHWEYGEQQACTPPPADGFEAWKRMGRGRS